MNEVLGSQVGVFRTTMRPQVFRLPILFAAGTALVIFLNLGKRGSSTDPSDLTAAALFAFVVSCGLGFAALWLQTVIWKVTLFEGGVRGPTPNFGFRTMAWGQISSAERIPLHLKSINPFHAVVRLQSPAGPPIVITEPLAGMQEFDEHVRRLAGEDHPFARALHEP